MRLFIISHFPSYRTSIWHIFQFPLPELRRVLKLLAILILTENSTFAICSVSFFFLSQPRHKSDPQIVKYITIRMKRSRIIWIQSDNWADTRTYIFESRWETVRWNPEEGGTRISVSHTHDQSISRLVNLTERRFHRIDEARYPVTNRAAFHLFALKTLMARSASPCPRNWTPEGLTVAKVNSMPVSLSRTVLAYPEGHSDGKDASFRSTSLCPKTFRSYRREFPFSLLTVHLPDHNSKYFTKMSANIYEDRSTLLRTGFFIF